MVSSIHSVFAEAGKPARPSTARTNGHLSVLTSVGKLNDKHEEKYNDKHGGGGGK